MANSWTIGSRGDCDLVVERPGVASHHCRLSVEADGYRLEDLRSVSGTFVNGARVAGKVPIQVSDLITLGPDLPIPWPLELSQVPRAVLRVGRDPENDVVINLPVVSAHHARVVWEDPTGKAVVEDLGSSNGTALGHPENKITRAVLSPIDTVYFGNHPVAGLDLLARLDPALALELVFRGAEMVIGRDPACQRVVDFSTVSARHARLRRSGAQMTVEDLGSSNGTFVNGRRIVGVTEVKAGDRIGLGCDSFRLSTEAGVARTQRVEPLRTQARAASPPRPAPTQIVASILPEHGAGLPGSGPPSWALVAGLILQAPVLASLLGLAASTPVAVLFGLSLASVWFGLTSALVGLGLDSMGRNSEPESASMVNGVARGGLLLGAGLVACVLAWGVASSLAKLAAPSFWAVGVMALAMGVGFGLGGWIVRLMARPALGWGAVGLAVVALGLLGGGTGRLASGASGGPASLVGGSDPVGVRRVTSGRAIEPRRGCS